MNRSLALALLSLTVVAWPASPQEFELPTPEEYARRAAAAEAAPLFQSLDPIRMTLTTDIEWLREERNDSIEVDGTVVFVDADGSEVTKPVQVRTRGNFRRDAKNCNFPPLRLDFPTGQMEGTVFEGQDKLKLVTPCHDGRDSYQNYIFDEYLAYRALQTVTPYSFRVRLVEITYVDVEDDYDSRTKVGFLIEDEEIMAERNRSTLIEQSQFHPSRMEGTHAVLVAMFNYLIGNSDWSPVFFHNSKLLRTEDGRYLTVPYDFDWSGVVNARYATPDPSLPIRNVRQRVYRGFCRPELQYEAAVAPFRAAREQIQAVYGELAAMGYEDFDEDDAEDALDYFEDFWEVVDDPGDFEDRIVERCRDMGE